MSETITNKILLSIFAVGGLVLTLIGVSYAAFTSEQFSTTENVLKTGTLLLSYNDGKNAINLASATPISDESATNMIDKGQYFDFSVTYNGKVGTSMNYDITLLSTSDILSTSVLDSKYLRLYLSEIPYENAELAQESNKEIVYYNDLSDSISTNGNIVKKLSAGTITNLETSTTKWYRLKIFIAKEDANGDVVEMKEDTIDPATGAILEAGNLNKEFTVKVGIITKN